MIIGHASTYDRMLLHLKLTDAQCACVCSFILYICGFLFYTFVVSNSETDWNCSGFDILANGT